MKLQFAHRPEPVKACGKPAAKTILFLAFVLSQALLDRAFAGGELVWHFDQGVVNSWGGEYDVYSREDSWARTYLDPGVHRPGSRHSLRITVHRDPIGFCGIWLDFYPTSGWPRRYLDASAYRFLSFWIKGSASGESFEIALADDTVQQHDDQNPARPLRAYLPHEASTEWQRAVIPLADFRGLNLHRLVRLTLNFTNSGDSRFYMDDIAFNSQRSAVLRAPKASLPAAPPAIQQNAPCAVGMEFAGASRWERRKRPVLQILCEDGHENGFPFVGCGLCSPIFRAAF